jgi:transcriptional regulator with XRE-family HTH domain
MTTNDLPSSDPTDPAIDPVVLRQLRTKQGLSQAAVARRAGMSVGHISRVEAGNRPATPAVIRGYENALGVRLSHLRAAGSFPDAQGTEDPEEMNRRAFLTAVASIAVGGPVDEPSEQAWAGLAPASPPRHVGRLDVHHVTAAQEMFTAWDLRFGGGMARRLARSQIQWATGLLAATMTDQVRKDLHTAVGSLAERVAWSSYDAGRHTSARSLFKLALHAATEADDADLRAHILSDIATQHLTLNRPQECLTLIRLASGDDRISDAVRCVLHGVQARAYGATGQTTQCQQNITQTEDTFARVTTQQTPDWMTGFLNQAHIHSVTGQAAYALANATSQFSDDAHHRLTRAISAFGSHRARATALCATRLATLHFTAGNTLEATITASTALTTAAALQSARITADLTTMHTAANHHQPGCLDHLAQP